MVFCACCGAGSQWATALQRVAVTHQLLTVTNESYINSLSVCTLLEKVALLGLQGPITLVGIMLATNAVAW